MLVTSCWSEGSFIDQWLFTANFQRAQQTAAACFQAMSHGYHRTRGQMRSRYEPRRFGEQMQSYEPRSSREQMRSRYEPRTLRVSGRRSRARAVDDEDESCVAISAIETDVALSGVVSDRVEDDGTEDDIPLNDEPGPGVRGEHVLIYRDEGDENGHVNATHSNCESDARSEALNEAYTETSGASSAISEILESDGGEGGETGAFSQDLYHGSRLTVGASCTLIIQFQSTGYHAKLSTIYFICQHYLVTSRVNFLAHLES